MRTEPAAPSDILPGNLAGSPPAVDGGGFDKARDDLVQSLLSGARACVLSGAPGLGKTTLLRAVAEALEQAGCAARLTLCHRWRAADEMLPAPDGDDGGRRALLLDEAQLLEPETLADVLRRAVARGIPVLLAGQPGIRAAALAALPRVVEPHAVVVRRLRPWSPEEIARLVLSRSGAGGTPDIGFAADAVADIARRSGGVPWLANRLASTSLFLAEMAGAARVEPALVAEAAAQLDVSPTLLQVAPDDDDEPQAPPPSPPRPAARAAPLTADLPGPSRHRAYRRQRRQGDLPFKIIGGAAAGSLVLVVVALLQPRPPDPAPARPAPAASTAAAPAPANDDLAARETAADALAFDEMAANVTTGAARPSELAPAAGRAAEPATPDAVGEAPPADDPPVRDSRVPPPAAASTPAPAALEPAATAPVPLPPAARPATGEADRFERVPVPASRTAGPPRQPGFDLDRIAGKLPPAPVAPTPATPTPTRAPLTEDEVEEPARLRQALIAGADPSAPLADGDAPLIRAVQRHDPTAVRQLLATGAAPDSRDATGRTPLLRAAATGDIDSVGALIAAGAQPNLAGPDGATPLIVAARDGKLDVVALLLRTGADVNLQADNGWTALMHAVWNQHWDIVERLVRIGANPALRNGDGDTAAMLAKSRRRPDLANRLELRQPPPR